MSNDTLEYDIQILMMKNETFYVMKSKNRKDMKLNYFFAVKNTREQ